MSNKPTMPADEHAYLAQQAEGAKRAMIRTAGEIGTTTEDLIDLDGRLKRSPWLTLGVVVAAGVLATELIPRRKMYAAPIEPQHSRVPNPLLATAFAPLADSVAQVLAVVAPAIVATLISPPAPAGRSEPPPGSTPVSEG